jgi:hypothetical protein
MSWNFSLMAWLPRKSPFAQKSGRQSATCLRKGVLCSIVIAGGLPLIISARTSLTESRQPWASLLQKR